jgi:hypothetical protein
MKITKIALAAVATIAFVGSAQAGTRYLTGASATSVNITKALDKLCTSTAGGRVAGATTVYKTDTTTTALGNFFTVKCSKDFAGLAGVDAVSLNVDGGSLTAVINSTINPAAVAVGFVPATGGTAATGDATGVLAGLALRTGVAASNNQISEGGFLDIEPAAFSPDLLLDVGGFTSIKDNQAPAAFSQAFGVAVSKKLYTALQTAQGIAASCNADDRAPACQPTISRAQYATIVAADENPAKLTGGAFLGVAAGKLKLARRVDTSGTQAASNQYFLNNLTGGTADVGGATSPANSNSYPVGGVDYPLFDSSEYPTTGGARGALGSTTDYVIGVLSLENTPKTTDNYRFVKLNRVEGFDVTTSATTRSKATAKSGEYDFVFNSIKFYADLAKKDVIDAIDAELADLTNNNGLFGNLESTFNRAGNNANVITKK